MLIYFFFLTYKILDRVILSQSALLGRTRYKSELYSRSRRNQHTPTPFSLIFKELEVESVKENEAILSIPLKHKFKKKKNPNTNLAKYPFPTL